MAETSDRRIEEGSIEARDLDHVVHMITDLKRHHEIGPTVFERAEGIHVWDRQGKQYIEGMAGLWCTALGYGDDELVKVAAEEMKRFSYGSLFFGRSHEPGILLAEKLCEMVQSWS